MCWPFCLTDTSLLPRPTQPRSSNPAHLLPLQLRKRVGDAEDKAVRLELMLPNSNGEFRALRAELEALEKVGGGSRGGDVAGMLCSPRCQCTLKHRTCAVCLGATSSLTHHRARMPPHPPHPHVAQEADQFSGMHERQAKATQTAVAAIKQALGKCVEKHKENVAQRQCMRCMGKCVGVDVGVHPTLPRPVLSRRVPPPRPPVASFPRFA